jgi:hypothetical protein
MSSMNTVPSESFDGFTSLRDAVSRFMEGGVLDPERAVFLPGRTFPVDILETPEEYVIEGTLFGTRPESIQITTTGNTLTIRTDSDLALAALTALKWDAVIPADKLDVTVLRGGSQQVRLELLCSAGVASPWQP